MRRSDRVRREYPDVPLVGVGALVITDSRVLLVRRGCPPGLGKWSIPGGLVDVGESLQEAVLRELEEEAGIRGCCPKLFAVSEVIVRDSRGVRWHYVIMDYLVKPLTLDVRAGGDVVDAKFFDIGYALENLDLTPSTKKLLKYVVGIGDVWSFGGVLTISVIRTV